MRLVIQRVTSASVSVGKKRISRIGPGVCVLVGITTTDTDADVDYCAKKLLRCKLWESDIKERVEILKRLQEEAATEKESGSESAVPPSSSNPNLHTLPIELPESQGKPWQISLADDYAAASTTNNNKKSLSEPENEYHQCLQVLLVSQFTLHAKLKKPKPDFHSSMGGEQAEILFNKLVEEIKKGVDGEFIKNMSGIQKNKGWKHAGKQQSGAGGKGKEDSINENNSETTCGDEFKDNDNIISDSPPDFSQRVQTGSFGAYMQVSIENDGPVTILVDSEEGVPRVETVVKTEDIKGGE